jgi:hypothetical protein
MKKVVLVAILLLAVSSAKAQQYRKFLFAFDTGYPVGNSNPIAMFAIEPAYRINDKILVGLRIEPIAFNYYKTGYNSPLRSMGLNGQYYFKLTSMRLFSGVGMGLYNPISNAETKNQRNGFAVYPRVGLDFGHARVMIEYNLIQKMNNYIPDTYSGHYETVNLSYLSLKIGLFIGGGKKK